MSIFSRAISSEAKARYPNAAEKLVFNEAMKVPFNGFVGDLITSSGKRRECILLKMSVVILSAAFSPAVEAQRRTHERVPLRKTCTAAQASQK